MDGVVCDPSLKINPLACDWPGKRSSENNIVGELVLPHSIVAGPNEHRLSLTFFYMRHFNHEACSKADARARRVYGV